MVVLRPFFFVLPVNVAAAIYAVRKNRTHNFKNVLFTNHATDCALWNCVDGHFQRKKKDTFMAELVIEGTCPCNGLHGFEMLIFNNVLNPKW